MHSPHSQRTIRFIFVTILLTLCSFALVWGKAAGKLANPPQPQTSSLPADGGLFMTQYSQRLVPWSARMFPTSFLSMPALAPPAAFIGYTITRESSPIIYVDCSQGQSAAYVAYKVTNTSGANTPDLWAQLAVSGDIMLNEDGNYHVGPLANGASTVVYFYVNINNCGNKASTNLTVNLYTTPPPFGVAAHTTTFAYTVTDDIKAVANKLNAVLATPNPPTIGGLVTLTGTGFTGNIGNDGIFAPTPASLPTWLADTFKLVDVTITFYNSPANIMSCNYAGAPTATFNDTLFIQNMAPVTNGNTACYKVEYVFVIQQDYATPKGVSPLTWISSGNPEKHNDLADQASVAIPLPQNNTTLSKTANPTSATANGTISYTITATNNSAVDVFLDSFKDTLPTGMTYTNNSSQYAATAIANPTIAGQMLTWNSVFRVPANGTASLTYQATLPANITCQTFINSAVAFVGVGVNAVQIDSTLPSNDNSPATASVADPNCLADLAITKTDSSATYTPGNAISYTIVVTNAGALNATGVSISDVVPAAITGVTTNCVATGTASCGTNASAGNNVSFTGVSINAGGGNFLTITVGGTVSAMATGNLDNTATVTPGGQSDPNTNNNSATDSNTSSAIADLVVRKDDGVTSVNAGGTTTYTVVVTNNGPSPANNAIFKDPAATGLTPTGVTCGSAINGAVCPTVANTTVGLMQGAGIVIPTLPNGGSVTFTINANVTATSGTVTNIATADPPSGTTDPTPASASDIDTVNPIADLVVTKSDGVPSVNAGGSTTYTVTLTNNGPSPANNATISDPAAAGLTKTALGACTPANGAVCPTAGAGAGELNITNLEAGTVVVPTLPSGGSISFTINATVTATSGTVTNTFTADPPSGTTDPTPATIGDTDNVNPIADLVATKTNGVTNVTTGNATTYTLTLINNGPSAANGATISDPAAAGLTKTALGACAAMSGAVCPTAGAGAGQLNIANLEAGTVVVPTLPSGGSISFTINATVTATTGTVTNTFTATPPAGTTDPTPATAMDTDSLGTAAPAMLTLKVGDPLVCNGPGGLASATAVVTNPNNTAQNVSFTATLPPQLAGLPGTCNASVNPGGCVVNGGSVTWNGQLLAGQSVTIGYQVQIAANVAQGTQLCTDATATLGVLMANAQGCLNVNCPACLLPPTPGANNVGTSAQKAGSLLVFPYFTSKVAEQKDTRLNIANIGDRAAFVHLFFVDGTSCNQADLFLCLTANASFAFKASEYDPENTGFVYAVAVNNEGRPIVYNGLIGNAFVREGDYVDNYAAEAFWRHDTALTSIAGGVAVLGLNGSQYDAAPIQFAVEIQSPIDTVGQRIVVAPLSGDLTGGLANLNGLPAIGNAAAQACTGLASNEQERTVSFSALLSGGCLKTAVISTSFPRVPNGLGVLIPTGKTGSLTFRVGAGVGLLMTPRTGQNQWSGIRALHKTAMGNTAIAIPVFVPVC